VLNEEELNAIRDEIAGAEDVRQCSIEALKIVQRVRGFVSDEAVRDVAPVLGMTPDELDGIATFYPFIFRRPVGRHIILVCDSVTCWVLGYETIVESLRECLGIGFGETTTDGRFTLLPVSCIGACDHAPAAMIDGRLYGDLNRQRIKEILDDHP
jgi:NADH-quinone oxidoreductase subunit E